MEHYTSITKNQWHKNYRSRSLEGAFIYLENNNATEGDTINVKVINANKTYSRSFKFKVNELSDKRKTLEWL